MSSKNCRNLFSEVRVFALSFLLFGPQSNCLIALLWALCFGNDELPWTQIGLFAIVCDEVHFKHYREWRKTSATSQNYSLSVLLAVARDDLKLLLKFCCVGNVWNRGQFITYMSLDQFCLESHIRYDFRHRRSIWPMQIERDSDTSTTLASKAVDTNYRQFVVQNAQTNTFTATRVPTNYLNKARTNATRQASPHSVTSTQDSYAGGAESPLRDRSLCISTRKNRFRQTH